MTLLSDTSTPPASAALGERGGPIRDLLFAPSVVTLTYLLDNIEQNEVLMLHHLHPGAGDVSYEKLNGFDREIAPHETPMQSAMQSVREHAGVEPRVLHFRGMVNCSGLLADQRAQLLLLFLVTRWDGLVRRSHPRGRLRWIDLDSLLGQQWPLWPGDAFFLPKVFDLDTRPFFGVLNYQEGVLSGWYCDRPTLGTRSPPLSGS